MFIMEKKMQSSDEILFPYTHTYVWGASGGVMVSKLD